jgi:predicted TIM-barrel fold metal-dependent hydrolase
VLEALLRAGGDRLRGIRNQTAWHEDPEITVNPVPPKPFLLADASFAEAARVLPRYGLTLDVFAYHTQLDEVIALADGCPQTTIILDHCGGPIGVGRYGGRREEVFSDWSAKMRRVAERPNVRLKLGGLAMGISGFDFHLEPAPPAAARLQQAWAPYILFCIEIFGPDRCMFQSNFPVDKGMVTYVSLWNAFKLITAGMAAGDRSALFHATACDTYRLEKGVLGLAGRSAAGAGRAGSAEGQAV